MRTWMLGSVMVGALACGGLGQVDGGDKARAFCVGDVNGELCRTIPSSTTSFRVDETMVEIVKLAMFDTSLEGTEVTPPPDGADFEGGQGFVVVVAYTNTASSEARLRVTMGCESADGSEAGSWPADTVYFTKGEPGWPDPMEPIVLPAGGQVKVAYVHHLTKETAVGGLLYFDGVGQPDLAGPTGKVPSERVVMEIPDFE